MPWELEDFLLKFDRWVERDRPSPDWSLAVMLWIHQRQIDPFGGATYEQHTDTWFAIVGDASDERFATCVNYLVTDRAGQRIRCSEIAPLRKPV